MPLLHPKPRECLRPLPGIRTWVFHSPTTLSSSLDPITAVLSKRDSVSPLEFRLTSLYPSWINAQVFFGGDCLVRLHVFVSNLISKNAPFLIGVDILCNRLFPDSKPGFFWPPLHNARFFLPKPWLGAIKPPFPGIVFDCHLACSR